MGVTPERLILFASYPTPGAVKTRLIPALGAEGAAQLHRQLTSSCLETVHTVTDEHDIDVEVCAAGADAQQMEDWLGPDHRYGAQGEGDLGARMARAFTKGFEAGAERIVIIGSDCPFLSPSLIALAFEALTARDLVIGPTVDGGSYLIGLSRFVPQLFLDIPWGTEKVLSRMLAIARKRGLETYQLEALPTVDRSEDLALLARAGMSLPRSAGGRRLSIIVSTYNEASTIGGTLARLSEATDAEIIVVDGGSRDGTPDIVQSAGVRLMLSAPEPTEQLRAGATVAQGDILLFMPADTMMPRGFDAMVRQALGKMDVAGGAFAFRTDRDGIGVRVIEALANMRSRILGMPDGGQALFIRREAYEAAGGIPDLPIMEVYELVRRLKKQGRVVTLPEPAITSGQRWEGQGFLRTAVLTPLMILGYHLGVSPERLARLVQSK